MRLLMPKYQFPESTQDLCNKRAAGIPLGHFCQSHCHPASKASPPGPEMPQQALGDTRFPLMPQLFNSTHLAVENGLDHSPLGSRDSPGSERSTTHSPLDSCSQPLCQPRTEKHNSQAAPQVQYVSVGPPDTACGWRGFTPECLQVFNTPKGFLFFLCAASFLQGMTVNGFINTVITSIERRYDLHSYQSGLIASSYDIAACLCLTFVSYFGGSGHKPRWLGWGVLLLGAGSLVFALPHFISGRYEAEVDEGTGMCPANQSVVCADSSSGLSHYRLVFMLGQFLHGVGATPLYTLGVTYLDENVKSSYSPVYIAVFYTAAILGPAAGYLIGGAMLNVYTEVGRRTHLTPESPLWVGAWWIGFLGAGATALIIAVPILGYPRQLPGSQRYVIMRAAETQQLKERSHKTAGSLALGKTVRDLPLSIWLLLKNPTFILLCLAGATEATLIASMSTFGPKFLEAQFSLSASEAASLFGLSHSPEGFNMAPLGSPPPPCLTLCSWYLVVPAGGGGTLLGGFLVNRFKLRGPGIVRFCLLCTLTSLLAFFVFLTHCPNVPMAGVTTGYTSGAAESIVEDGLTGSACIPLAEEGLCSEGRLGNTVFEEWSMGRSACPLIRSLLPEGHLNLTATCNEHCSCQPEHYRPVCDANGTMYYSPCHAGCLGPAETGWDGQKGCKAQSVSSCSPSHLSPGYLVVPAGGGGTLLGGFLVNRFKLRGPGIVRFCLLCTLTSLLAFFVFLTHCPNVPMAGVTTGYTSGAAESIVEDGLTGSACIPLAEEGLCSEGRLGNTVFEEWSMGRSACPLIRSLLPEGHLNLTATCNEHCSCQPEHYRPVCDANGTMYYSPCHAGCLGPAETGWDGQKLCPCEFGPGHCREMHFNLSEKAPPSGSRVRCNYLYIPQQLTATLRCVLDQQRSFALGIQWIVVRTLGSIPGPIAFGWVIDKACLLWQNQCSHQGSCFVYQNAAMSRYILVVGLVYKWEANVRHVVEACMRCCRVVSHTGKVAAPPDCRGGQAVHTRVSVSVLGFLFFAAACFLYESPSGPLADRAASLPSQSSASEGPSDLQLQSAI
ncbi:Solute carrier organic anion transporter family member 4A1 [Heterocephalus glaber]|uniref:Solute carrier organic anion transporter family member 4A1 n=1 Tax=Heterocephalus glaber TaxID=10181 RepID=G5C8E7_HETGA|nr:Solute carrier organic anion transporter family member 4A1 [Heterocephalus glaber]